MADYAAETATLDAKPDEAGGYWSDKEKVADAVAKRRKLADQSQQDWRNEANDIIEFVAGKQWEDEDVKYMEDVRKKPPVTFNRVGPIINAVCGQQICNRQETRFLPREQGDMQTAELWTSVVSWAREQCDAEDEESDAFRDMVVTGMGWTCTNVAYDVDPAGMIKEERKDPRRMRWDPSSRKKNLADARWVQCDYWWDRQEINERWPEAEDIEIEPAAFVSSDSDSHDRPHDAANAWRYSKNNFGKDLIAGQYRVIHDLHWRLEDVYQIADVDGSITKLTPKEWKQLERRLLKLGLPSPKAAKTKSRCYYEAWIVGATVLHFGKYDETDFEYQAMTGLRDEDGAWYGLAKPLMDPQRFANKVFSEIVAILASNAKGGILAERGAVQNPRKFEEEWSKSDGVAWVEDGAVSNGRIQPKPPPQIPAELTKLLEYSIGGMREVTGVNVEFLGQTDKVQPGVVEAMRTKAGLIILAPWFDAMRLYMKRQGRLLGEYINKYIADGRWVRITGVDNQPQQQQPQPQPGMQPPGMPPQGPGMQPPGPPMPPPPPPGIRFVQLAKQPDVGKYDIVVDEATQSRDARERTFQGLMQIMPLVVQSGVPVPPDVVDYLPLPEQLRMKWKELLLKKQAEPPPPPPQVIVEQIRGQNAKQLEEMRGQQKTQAEQLSAQLKAQEISMVAQTERVTQAAQFESQRLVDQSKLQLETALGMMEAQRKEREMIMDAKIDAFEIMLRANVDIKKAKEQAAINSEQENKVNSIMPQVEKAFEGQKKQLLEMMKILAGPETIERDPVTGRPERKKRSAYSPTAKTLDEQIAELSKVLMADEVMIRDKNGRGVGKRRVLN